MKKILMFTLVSFIFSNIIFSQNTTNYLKSYIGLTKIQIKEYWSTKVSDECFSEGTYTDSKQDFFSINSFTCIQDGSSGGFAGHPAFTATFDSLKRMCISHSTKFSVHNISIITAQLKQAGYHYDEVKGGWVDNIRINMWTLEPADLMSDGSTTSVYLITCQKYPKK